MALNKHELTEKELKKYTRIATDLCYPYSVIEKLKQAKTEEECDRTTLNFVDWFIEEQIQEEKDVKNIIKRLELFGEDKVALFLMDKELSERKD